MALRAEDRELITAELGREPSREEAALFENLWSEHCAYRSSRPLLTRFDSAAPSVVVGPGDDAAVVKLGADTAITIGIESHNHPSYVDPYDGAATGVGGIVRDTLSMGGYPIALADCLYFGEFTDEHPRYLFEGVVEGIADYGNAIGVPTVTGSATFHPDYEGNPLVNVGCIGLVSMDRIVTAEAQSAGNKLVLVGNATGRDGLGGASFASEDLSEDAEVEDRPAVQVGDPYTEKLLIEANEALLDADLVEAARDLGAAGLGGATSELAAKGGLGTRIELSDVHQREPGMSALEILLAESQERMCYEVKPADVSAVRELASRYDLGCSVIGELTAGNYVCAFEGDVVVDVPAEFLADGAPIDDREAIAPAPPPRNLPDVEMAAAFEAVVGSPNTASKEWVYRQYDHEVGVRTATRPGDDAAILAIREADLGLALAAGGHPHWTSVAPYDGARAVALEVATNLAAKGATPLAAVDCLNGGNPETPEVFGGIEAMVEGLAEMCRELAVPVVGGNVSLYNDSASGPIPPTPTLFMEGTKAEYTGPPCTLDGAGDLLLVGEPAGALGGSEFLAQVGGSDQFPSIPASPLDQVEAIADVANQADTLAVHDISHGGLAVSLAESITTDAGARISLGTRERPAAELFGERPGRVLVETTDPESVRATVNGILPVIELGTATTTGTLDVSLDSTTLSCDVERIRELRRVLERELG